MAAPEGGAEEDKARALDLALPRGPQGLRRLRGLSRQVGDLGLRVARSMAVAAGVGLAVLSASVLVTWGAGFLEALRALFGSGGDAPERVMRMALMAWSTLVMVAQVGVFGASGVFALRVGLTQDLLPRRMGSEARVLLEEGEARPFELHGTPGIAVTVGFDPGRLRVDESLQLVARIMGDEGEYLPSRLRAFEGDGGELRVRRSWSHDLALAAPAEELGLFLPLLAVEPELLREREDLRVEVLAFAGGAFQSRVEVPLTGRLEALPDPLAEMEALAAPEEVELLAAEVLAEDARCGVCGDHLEGEAAVVHCDRCASPHHPDCWDFLGYCSTYGCQGARSEGPAGEEAATAQPLPVPVLPRAEPLRLTDAPALSAGDFPGGAGLSTLAVPRAPRSVWELRPVAAGYALGVMGLPLLLFVLLALASPLIAGGITALTALLCWVQPRTLRTLIGFPAALAAPRLTRAFPPAGPRDYSHNLRILRVRARAASASDGGGTRVDGVLLVWGLLHHRLDLILRLRGPSGYLEAALPEVRGVYRELRLRHTTEPVTTDDPHALRFALRVRGDGPELPEDFRLQAFSGELLVSCEGEVLSEIDFPVPFAPRVEAKEEGAPPVMAGRAKPVEVDPEETAPPRNAACALCGAEPVQRVVTCYTCHHTGHSACWDFLGACPRCGSPDGVDGTHWGADDKRH